MSIQLTEEQKKIIKDEISKLDIGISRAIEPRYTRMVNVSAMTGMVSDYRRKITLEAILHEAESQES